MNSKDDFSDIENISVDDDDLLNLDETRVIKRRERPSINKNIKNLFNKYF